MGEGKPAETSEAGTSGWTPVLGLSDEAERVEGGARWPAAAGWAAVAGTVYDQPEPENLLELTVIVPAQE